MPFNDTTNETGIVQLLEKELGATPGDLSGNPTKLKRATAEINSALRDFIAIALRSSKTWQYDDSNHTDYPIITTNLVSGQRSYAFTTDEQENLILDIYKVLVADTSGVFSEITPVDVQSEQDTSAFYDGRNLTGTPTRYDKTANGIFLDPIPSYNATGGLKIYINRDPSLFVYSDTTKKPGIPSIFHKYLAFKPALAHARRNSRANYALLKEAVEDMEGDEARGIQGSIAAYFSARTRDERGRISVAHENNQ